MGDIKQKGIVNLHALISFLSKISRGQENQRINKRRVPYTKSIQLFITTVTWYNWQNQLSHIEGLETHLPHTHQVPPSFLLTTDDPLIIFSEFEMHFTTHEKEQFLLNESYLLTSAFNNFV